MGHSTCCVVNCKNTGSNSNCKFYKFPTSSWKLDQRLKWIAAIKRVNADGTLWTPHHRDSICSAHFIGGKKSDEMASPSYFPQIFPSAYGTKKFNETAMLKRHERFKARVLQKFRATHLIPQKITKGDKKNSKVHIKPELSNKNTVIHLTSNLKSQEIAQMKSQHANVDKNFKLELFKQNTAFGLILNTQSQDITEVKYQCSNIDEHFNEQNTAIHILSNTHSQEMTDEISEYSNLDKGCQIDMSSDFEDNIMTFTSNRYIYSEFCHAEIQTEIPKNPTVGSFICKKEECDIDCETDQLTTVTRLKSNGYILGF